MRLHSSILLLGLAFACGDDSQSAVDADGSTTSTAGSSSGSSIGGTATSDSSSESGSESSSTGPMPCVSDDECTNAAAPFCGTTGECGSCDETSEPNTACEGADPLLPLCVGDACVACTDTNVGSCSGDTPVCDDATNTCVACTEHDQCGEAACNLYTGACLPTDAVVHVGPGQEFLTLTQAIASFGPGAEGTIVVHEGDYNESATVAGDQVLAFLGSGSDVPRWVRNSGNSPQLTVATGSTVLMDGVQVSANASTDVPGVLVDGGRAWLDRSRIVQNSGGGIVAENGAELTLRNCFVGGSVNNVAALTVNGATAIITYTTIGAGYGTSSALACDGGATVDVRNSLFISEGATGEVQCGNASIEHSAAEVDLGGTNVGLGEMSTTWFLAYAAGDFHLTTAPVIVGTTAQWMMDDPIIDIDGNARPGIDGSPDFAGADVP